MSGSTVGGVIGGAIGFWIGGPAGAQWGWMIGSAVGGYVDPEVIEGPRLKDLRGTTSAVGGVIPRAWGTAPVPCNIIWQQPGVTEVKNTESGKGGPEQVTYTYTRSYAVMFHLGEIAGVLQIKRNGKIVYDARDDATLEQEYTDFGLTTAQALARITGQRAENSKFIDRCTIYTGTQTQNPDPTIESYKGTGNVPSYRGRAYMVVTDDDVTELAGAIPQYEVVVAACGDVTTVEPTSDVQWLALADASGSGSPNFRAIRTSVDGEDWSGTPISYGGSTQFSQLYAFGDSILLSHGSSASVLFSNDRGSSFTPGTLPAVGGAGSGRGFYSDGKWFVTGGNSEGCFRSSDGVNYTQPDTSSQAKFSDICKSGARLVAATTSGNPGYVSISEDNGDSWAWQATAGTGFIGPKIAANGTVIVVAATMASGKVELTYSQDGGDTWAQATSPFSTNLTTSDCSLHYSGVSGVFVASNDNGEVAYSSNGVSWTLATTPLTGGVHVREFSSGSGFIVGCCNDATFIRSEDGITWDDFPLVSSTEDVLDVHFIGPGSGTPIPDAPGWYTDVNGEISGPGYETITPCGTTTIGEIVAELCEMSGLTSDEYDVSDLTDTLTGYVVARETDAASVIETLRPLGMFDPAEWDGKVRFVKRGGTAVGSINGDDLVERDGDAYERELVQEAELLRRVTTGYIDPAAGFAPNTQKYERRAGTVQARGEATFEVSAVIDADQAATVSKRKVLTAWGEPEKQKFGLPYRLAKYTPTDILNHTHDDGEVYTIRIMQAEDDSGIRHMESATNCAEAYDATATGVPPLPPTVTDTSSLRGPTVLKAMNLDSLRAQDNVPGMYFAAAGVLGGWVGCVVQMSTDAGTSFRDLVTIARPATMGYLTSGIGTSGEPVPVALYPGGQLSSATPLQVADGANSAAIVTSDVAEIVQFETATATTGGYDLTDVTRGVRDTTPAAHSNGDAFVILDANVIFAPISTAFSGQTLIFRAVTLGTSADAAETVSVVYEPPTFVLDGGGA